MRILASFHQSLIALIAVPAPLYAQATEQVRETGVSAIWVLANIVYAGMRAQSSTSAGWRIVAFIFGLPGTIVTLLAVKEGSERAYGVDLLRRRVPPES